MISDTLAGCGVPGLVVGVDNSERRLGVCRALLHKSLMAAARNNPTPALRPRQLLFHSDGTSFDMTMQVQSAGFGGGEHGLALKYDSLVMQLEVSERGSSTSVSRKRLNKSARSRERAKLKSALSGVQSGSTVTLFDRVLVDAECTHSGSYRHMRHVDDNEADKDGANVGDVPAKPKASKSFTDESRRASLPDLQRRLAQNGFRQLRPGSSGLMVYSTCSQEVEQNELVVKWLLDIEPTCVVVPAQEVLAAHASVAPLRTTQSVDVAALLHMSNEELVARHKSLPESELRQISEQVCDFVAEQTHLPIEESELLPGTFALTRHGGTSGMFFACLRKRED